MAKVSSNGRIVYSVDEQAHHGIGFNGDWIYITDADGAQLHLPTSIVKRMNALIEFEEERNS